MWLLILNALSPKPPPVLYSFLEQEHRADYLLYTPRLLAMLLEITVQSQIKSILS